MRDGKKQHGKGNNEPKGKVMGGGFWGDEPSSSVVTTDGAGESSRQNYQKMNNSH